MNKNDLNGWVLLDKEEGISSASALNRLRKILERPLKLLPPNVNIKRTKKIKMGHAGTLDPFATGLLMVAIGEATKTINYVMDAEKEYEFTISWGESRDTIDIEGKIIATSDLLPVLSDIIEAAQSFKGEIMQIPPSYSAIKIQGYRACDLARLGQEVVIDARKVGLYDIKVLENLPSQTTFYINCSKGFYVRALARDIAEKLGVCGYVSKLRRTSIGKFYVSDAISLAKIEELVHNADQLEGISLIKPIQSVLDDILVRQVTEEQSNKLRQGQKIEFDNDVSGTVAVMCNQKLVALCEAFLGYLQPKKVFNL